MAATETVLSCSCYMLSRPWAANGGAEADATVVSRKGSSVTASRNSFGQTTYNMIDKTCLLNPDRGPCRGEIVMYYFNPQTKDCSKFFWGGCQGNGNRFDSRYDCIQNCLRAPDSRRRRPRWCSLTFDYGFCFGSLTRWYYDPIWKVCKERIYSGCGGNKNNFYNKEQCESICTYQMGALKSKSKKKDRVKKILIINPIGATSKRGKSQQSTTKLWKVTSNKTQ